MLFHSISLLGVPASAIVIDSQSEMLLLSYNTVLIRCIPQHSLDLNPDFRCQFPKPAIV